ncbi:hypothetical protein [uncultured Bacteroides sp.]|uniref:hypothetical protein n=1 Tax=uncultured Bacteroides sp. TaxID=162156 RepID=UPI002AA95061|nr:hypothetical protein [uncultured Bacteroides sp.]
MKKNFVKVMLLVALAFSTTVSFIGCKNYDDDIDGLKESITATNSDLSTKATALEASIASLKSAQTDVTAAIAKATDDAEKASLQAKTDAIASSLASMTTIKTDLTTLINSNTTDITTLNQKTKGIEEDLTSVEGSLSAIQKMLVGYTDLVETVGKLQSAMSRIDQIENSLQSLSAEVEQALKDIATQKTTLETQQDAIAKLEALTGTHSEELSTVQEEIKTLLANLETQKAALDKAATKDELAAVQASVDANKASIEDLSTSIDTINTKINNLSSLFFSMITNISFVSEPSSDINLTTVTCTKDNYTFGDEAEVSGGIPFKKGQKYTMESEKILIQVSPSTADVDDSSFSLMKSDGKTLDNLVNLTVKANETALTKAKSIGGIWEVTVQLKNDFDATELSTATIAGSKKYLFAIAAKETTKDIASDRVIASPYKLTFAVSNTYTAATNIDNSIVNKVTIGNNIPVEINAPFAVDVKGNNGGIYASYITLYQASGITDNDMVVWRSYNITGINAVSTDNNLSINIPSDKANGKTIYFKIHAVDFSGNTIIEKTFSVICGKQNSAKPSLTAEIKPEEADASNIYNMPKAVKMTANLATTDADASNLLGGTYSVSIKDMSAQASFYKEDLSTILSLNSVDNIKAIAAIKLSNIDLTKIPDGGSVTGNIAFKNVNGLQILNVPITLSKTMPDFPNAFSAKTGMLNNKIITVFPTFTGNTSKATFEYTKIFNMINNTNSSYFKFASVTDQGTKIDFTNSDIIQVDNSLVGSNKSPVDMKVSYNYGQISSVTTNNYWKPLWDTVFAIKFASIPEESEITLDKAFTITYPTASKILIHHASTGDGGYIITKADDKNTTSMKLIVGENDIQLISLKTTSGNNIENEYYKPTLNNDGSITFTKNSDSAVINENISSTLVITITDVFGNTFEKKVVFTVIKP